MSNIVCIVGKLLYVARRLLLIMILFLCLHVDKENGDFVLQCQLCLYHLL